MSKAKRTIEDTGIYQKVGETIDTRAGLEAIAAAWRNPLERAMKAAEESAQAVLSGEIPRCAMHDDARDVLFHLGTLKQAMEEGNVRRVALEAMRVGMYSERLAIRPHEPRVKKDRAREEKQKTGRKSRGDQRQKMALKRYAEILEECADNKGSEYRKMTKPQVCRRIATDVNRFFPKSKEIKEHAVKKYLKGKRWPYYNRAKRDRLN